MKTTHFTAKARRSKGQNSFSDHFREVYSRLLADRISHLLGQEQPDEFIMEFLLTRCSVPWNAGHAEQGVHAAGTISGKDQSDYGGRRSIHLSGDGSDRAGIFLTESGHR